MRIAFYSPMKDPDDPIPSGEREMARLLLCALEDLGAKVEIISRFRSWTSNPEDQPRLQQAAEEEACTLLELLKKQKRNFDVFLTYHLYHKAPDWIGPKLAGALKRPYLVLEASRAFKHKKGPWKLGFDAVDAALLKADCVAALHAVDKEGLRALVSPDHLDVLAPFIDTEPFETIGKTTKAAPALPVNLVTVAMMRKGDKLASYLLLAKALRYLPPKTWCLDIAGDGPARASVEEAMHGLPVHFSGKVAKENLADFLALKDLYVWPAINEAFGLAFLEAEAAGLPVIGARTGGVPDIVVDGVTGLLPEVGNAKAFAAAIETLVNAPQHRLLMGQTAYDYCRSWHSLAKGQKSLKTLIDKAMANHKKRRND